MLLNKNFYYFYIFIKSFLFYFFSPDKKPKLNFLEIWVGTKCTLKCKYCFHMIPYFEDKVFLDCEDILDDFVKILEIIDINCLSFAGGEPFLHPEFYKILDFISENNFSFKEITMPTNGTVIPDVKLISAMKKLSLKTKFILRVGGYKFVGNKDDKYTEFYRILDENKIQYIKSFENSDWVEAPMPTFIGNDLETTRRIFKLCIAKSCFSFFDGTLYPCCRDIGAKKIYKQKYNFFEEVNFRNIGTNLRKSIVKARIETCIQEKVFKDCCKYCYGLYTIISKRVSAGVEQVS